MLFNPFKPDGTPRRTPKSLNGLVHERAMNPLRTPAFNSLAERGGFDAPQSFHFLEPENTYPKHPEPNVRMSK